MKRQLAILGALLTTHLAFGQGTFVYDQQSSDPSHPVTEDKLLFYQAPWPVQSFTPSLTGIGFIQLWGMDAAYGTQLAVNLRANSPDGAVLGTTSTVILPGRTNYTGPLTFLFSSEILLESGNLYYMEPFIVKPASFGVSCGINAWIYGYTRGRLYIPGDPLRLGYDLWFREGIVVPEPGTMALVLLGASCFMWRRRRQ